MRVGRIYSSTRLFSATDPGLLSSVSTNALCREAVKISRTTSHCLKKNSQAWVYKMYKYVSMN